MNKIIWVRRTPSECGSYVDRTGARYELQWCHRLLTPDGSTEAENGYEQHPSVDAACDAWGLVPWVDPNAEPETLT